MWEPNTKQREFLITISSMTVECLMGSGTVDRGAYTSNLRTMADMLDKIEDE